MMDPRNAYRESVARGASAVLQVVLLYERVVEDLRRAGDAITENNVGARTSAINHALLVVAHLQASLDREAGGEVARNLDRFYNLLRQKLLEVQFQPSRPVLDEQITFLLDMCDAWRVVDRAERTRLERVPPSAPATTAAASSATPSGAEIPAFDWNA